MKNAWKSKSPPHASSWRGAYLSTDTALPFTFRISLVV
jgi:hypothetical protein